MKVSLKKKLLFLWSVPYVSYIIIPFKAVSYILSSKFTQNITQFQQRPKYASWDWYYQSPRLILSISCWNQFSPNCHLKIRVDKSSSELICVINFKPKSLGHRLHRSTPDMVSVIRAANLYMTNFRLASRVREIDILISEIDKMRLEIDNINLDPSKMLTRLIFCPRRDWCYQSPRRVFWAICSAETTYLLKTNRFSIEVHHCLKRGSRW